MWFGFPVEMYVVTSDGSCVRQRAVQEGFVWFCPLMIWCGKGFIDDYFSPFLGLQLCSAWNRGDLSVNVLIHSVLVPVITYIRKPEWNIGTNFISRIIIIMPALLWAKGEWKYSMQPYSIWNIHIQLDTHYTNIMVLSHFIVFLPNSMMSHTCADSSSDNTAIAIHVPWHMSMWKILQWA